MDERVERQAELPSDRREADTPIAASLYAHVSGKAEPLELVFDELVGQVPLLEPDPKIWREQVRQMARDLRSVLISHRDAALARLPTT